MITLVGTGHVFDLRKRVQEEIFRRAPDVVAIELDPPRYAALRNPPKERQGPLAYRVLAGFQERLAERYGVRAGDEMLAAADAASDLRVPVALIDRDAAAVFRRAWREMRVGERLRLLGALLVGAVVPGKSVEKQLDEMQGDYGAAFEELGRKFPTVKRVVLDERDQHMANALVELEKRHPRVVAVVGDGHVEGLTRLLASRGASVETVRLKALRGATEPPKEEPASVTFRVEYEA